MGIRRYIFFFFILVFAWNGSADKKCQKREKTKSTKFLKALAVFQKHHIDTNKLRLQMNEIEEYNLKLFSQSKKHYATFRSFRIELGKYERDCLSSSDRAYIKKIKKVSKNDDLPIIIKSFEEAYKQVSEDLGSINKRIEKNRNKKVVTYTLKYAQKIFSENLKLTRSLARLTLAKKLHQSLEKKARDLSESLYDEIHKKTHPTTSAQGNFDSDTMFGPQASTRLVLLIKSYNKLLASEKRDSLKGAIEKQETSTEKIDQFEGCLETYAKAYQEITYKGVSKLLMSREDKVRTKHLKDKMTNIASEDSEVRNRELEESLIKYFGSKSSECLSSKRQSSQDKGKRYAYYAKALKECLALEDELFDK